MSLPEDGKPDLPPESLLDLDSGPESYSGPLHRFASARVILVILLLLVLSLLAGLFGSPLLSQFVQFAP
jgi:hypothetical protein